MHLGLATPAGEAAVELDRPSNARGLLVLTHGAGGGVDTADLMAIRDSAVDAGVAVARVLQPYRVAGRRAPPKPAAQDPAWIAAVSLLTRRRGLGSVPLVLGGRSNGARVACRTALALKTVGVIALAFPLHPPGRPENTRIVELDGAGVPVLVVQGDRDPFGMPTAGPSRTVVTVRGANHSLSRDPAAVADAVLATLERWI